MILTSLLKVFVFALMLQFSVAHAVLFYSTGDPNYNTTAPIGELAGSGWELQGFWGNFQGTPIDDHHFITAKHIPGMVVGNPPFLFDNHIYTTTAFFDDPKSDLRIVKVNEKFSRWAKLYKKFDEAGKNIVFFGRGTQRGEPVFIKNRFGQDIPKGWIWGPYDGRLRWGENTVFSAAEAWGMQLIRCTFDANGLPNEAHASYADSGGAIFIKDDHEWKLAGILLGVDGSYSLTPSGKGFGAALFDQRGLFIGGENNWHKIPDYDFVFPASFYATRTSWRYDWIQQTLLQSSTNGNLPVLQFSSSVSGPYTKETSYEIDQNSKTITLPKPSQIRFYRLEADQQFKIINISVQNEKLVIRYQ